MNNTRSLVINHLQKKRIIYLLIFAIIKFTYWPKNTPYTANLIILGAHFNLRNMGLDLSFYVDRGQKQKQYISCIFVMWVLETINKSNSVKTDWRTQIPSST